MFTDFLFHLRSYGIKVTITEWLTLMEALALGFDRAHLLHFYYVARTVLIKKETQYDTYDRAFATFFEGLEDAYDLSDELLDWLSDPVLPRELSPEEIAAMEALDMDELRRQFEERLQEQEERHDGGNRWVGTGGTSPFGNGGTNPNGIRVGGSGGGRSAVQIATERRFQNLRSDRVLDTRQIGTALRRLRKWAKDDGPEELDLDKTIDESARNGGEIEIIFGPPRANKIKLLLLMDVGGSMDPHADLCERLFSAAHKASHFKKFKSYFFHNCPYEKLYEDIYHFEGPTTDDVLKNIDQTWSVVFVGDAYMHPYELTQKGGAIYYYQDNGVSGLDWLKKFRQKCPNSVWLNPERQRIWNAPSIRLIRTVFPMFELTIDGLTEAVDTLRGARPNHASVEPFPNPYA